MAASIIPSKKQTPSLNRQYQENQKDSSAYCSIQWRQGQLLVKQSGQLKQPFLTPLENQEYLVKCLKHSPVNLVRIDIIFGKSKLKLWADACEQAAKPMFLRIPSTVRQVKSSNLVWQRLRRVLDWLTAFILVPFLLPVMLGIIAFMRFNSKESFFEREWHIGERGRLFRLLKFRTNRINSSALDDEILNYQGSLNKLEKRYNFISFEKWIVTHGLDNLPQLFNVLRGDICLFGSRCWTLEEAVRLSPGQQHKLNRLPGMISLWEVESEPNLLHLDGQTS